MTSKEARGLSSQRWVRPIDRSGRSHESGHIQFQCSELNLCIGTPRTPQIVLLLQKLFSIFSSAPMLSQRLLRTSVPSALTRRDSDSRDRHFTGEKCYSFPLFQFWNVWHHEKTPGKFLQLYLCARLHVSRPSITYLHVHTKYYLGQMCNCFLFVFEHATL